jgi:glycine dehydrogenase subunit 1
MIEKVYDKPFFKEFVLKANFDVEKFNNYLLDQGILGPLQIKDDQLLFAVTEKRTKAELDLLIEKVVNFK